MTRLELIQSWIRTEDFLLDTRAQIFQMTEGEFSKDLAQFDMFIKANQLGLAFETLELIVSESQLKSLRIVELLTLAASSMDLLGK
jgi:hypothetical protein